MSITGLAAVTARSIEPQLILLIWVWALICLLFVEGIEVFRAILRIKMLGALRVIGSYHVTQWSRIFTFGMLYAFTNAFQLSQSSGLTVIRSAILIMGPWIVLFLLINETLLIFKANIKRPVEKGVFYGKKA